MNKEDFIQMTGREPIQDDLERCNCDKAGTPGHYTCGVCKICNCPKFECMKHIVKELK